MSKMRGIYSSLSYKHFHTLLNYKQKVLKWTKIRKTKGYYNVMTTTVGTHNMMID